ncbi:MAG: head decoration protein [Muribaculaceae bacterium]|nr:head decoration protein [Muribaculaceae bacterium]
MNRHDEVIGSVGYDNLINGLTPGAEVFSVQLAANQGVLERGTLLATADGGMVMISADTTGKANAVLAEAVDTGAGEAVEAIAYRTGHFNTNSLIVAEGYDITAADKEALRVAGILISDAVAI